MKKILAFLLCASLSIGQESILPKTSVLPKTTAMASLRNPAVFINSAFTSIVGCAAAATSCVLTYSPTAGHQLYIGLVESAAQTVTSVSDNGGSGGSTYTNIVSRTSVNSGTEFLSMYCTTTVASSVTTITSNGGGQVVMAMEFSGDAGACTIDKTNLTIQLNSATTSWVSGATSATTNANDIAFGMFFDITTGNPGWTGSNGYACITGSRNAFTGAGNSMCYKILSATGAQTASATLGTADSGWGIIAVAK